MSLDFFLKLNFKKSKKLKCLNEKEKFQIGSVLNNHNVLQVTHEENAGNRT